MIHAARLILAITATMLSGCAWAKFRAYEGGQQEQWPTSQGAFVERNHAIPAYFSPPPRPYRVIGYIDATTAPIRRGGVVAFAARRAKEQGADAIIVLEEGSEYAGSFAFASGSTTSNYTGSYSGTSDYTGRAQYLGGGTTRFSGDVEHRGMLRGFGTSSSFASATSAPFYRGTAQVIAIKFVSGTNAPSAASNHLPYGIPFKKTNRASMTPGGPEVDLGRTVTVVKSPYTKEGAVEVTGMSRGTQVKCPYTGKTFLVP